MWLIKVDYRPDPFLKNWFEKNSTEKLMAAKFGKFNKLSLSQNANKSFEAVQSVH